MNRTIRIWILAASIITTLATPWVEASTGIPGYFGWLMLSFFAFIPILLVIPVIGIYAAKSPSLKGKIPWVLSSAFLAVLSYGTLLWAGQKFTLGATESWPLIYLWVLPSYVQWFIFRKRCQKKPN